MRQPLAQFEELTGSSGGGVEGVVGRASVELANRTSRRTFLGVVGRTTFAALGGGFLALLWQEKAWGAECYSGLPLSCLCEDARGDGVNACRAADCAGGSWLYCDPNRCYNPDTRLRYYTRYRDCLSTCNQGPRHGPGGCDICINSSPYRTACGPKETCTTGQDRVFCVTWKCSTISC
jgi:hypothetical protein